MTRTVLDNRMKVLISELAEMGSLVLKLLKTEIWIL